MSKTLENLTKAFVGESQARNRYAMFASIARKEGYLQVADIFLETAEQEREHASWFMKMIQQVKEKEGYTNNELEIETSAFIKLGTTLENLGFAVAGETHEFDMLYPEFAKTAQEEGYPQIAARILSIAKAEVHHAQRYQKLHDQIANETIRNKPEAVERVCTKCGYVHTGTTPPAKCPSCDHEKEYYIVKNEIY